MNSHKSIGIPPPNRVVAAAVLCFTIVACYQRTSAQNVIFNSLESGGTMGLHLGAVEDRSAAGISGGVMLGGTTEFEAFLSTFESGGSSFGGAISLHLRSTLYVIAITGASEHLVDNEGSFRPGSINTIAGTLYGPDPKGERRRKIVPFFGVGFILENSVVGGGHFVNFGAAFRASGATSHRGGLYVIPAVSISSSEVSGETPGIELAFVYKALF